MVDFTTPSLSKTRAEQKQANSSKKGWVLKAKIDYEKCLLKF